MLVVTRSPETWRGIGSHGPACPEFSSSCLSVLEVSGMEMVSARPVRARACVCTRTCACMYLCGGYPDHHGCELPRQNANVASTNAKVAKRQV